MMSTFYGGEQLVNVVNIAGTDTSTGTLYTVPSGRYAEIFVLLCARANVINVIINGGAYNIKEIDSNNIDVPNNLQPITVYAGDYLNKFDSILTSYNFIIKEYALP